MTKSKNTKRALLASVLSMILCLAMLVGSTFAWFTDSVTSGKNRIVAGNLDVELEYATEFYEDGSVKTWTPVTAVTELFSELEADGETKNLWEPGHTEAVYLKISNVGNLALKYQFSVTGSNETVFTNALGKTDCKLSDYLVFGKAESTNEIAKYASREAAWQDVGTVCGLREQDLAKSNDLLLPGAAEYVALVVYMPTTIGNEANYRGDVIPSIDLGVNLVATQTSHENDSFDNQYDVNAEYPIIPIKVATADEFVEAIGNGEDVALTEDIALTDIVAVTNDVTIYANGKTITTAANRLMWADNDDVTVTIDNANFVSTNNSSNSRGLQINPNKSNVDLIIKDSKITMNNVGDNYGVNICGGVANSSLTLINCEITAYQCVNIYGRDMTVNIDGCTFTYVNMHNKGWAGGFITLFCGEGCENIDLTVKNTQFITGTVADGCAAPKAPVYYNNCTGSHNHNTTVENCTLDGVTYSE